MAFLSRSTALILAAALAAPACGDRGLDEETPTDREAPLVTVDKPDRATFVPGTGGTVTVSGTASDPEGQLDRVEVNGVKADLRADGSFEVDVPVAPGITLLQTVARDTAGNQATDTRAVLAGELAPLTRPVENAFAIRLAPTAFAAVGEAARSFVTGQDLGALIAPFNPVLSVGPNCAAAADVNVIDIQFQSSRLTLTPRAGALALTVELEGLDVPLDVDTQVACIPGDFGASLTADRFTLQAELAATVDSGAFTVQVTTAEAAFEGFALDAGIIPSEIVDLIQPDLDETVADQLTAQLQELVVPQLEGLLAGLAAGRTFDVLGKQVTLAVAPRELTLEEAGARLVVDATLSAAGTAGANGYLVSPAPLPALDSDASFDLAIADDVANQALAAFTAAGGLDISLSLGGGEYGDIGELFDRIHIRATLPPVVTIAADGLALAVGDLRCDFEKDEGGGTVSTTALALSASARIDLVATEAGLRMAVGEPELHADFEEATGANSLAEPEIERLGAFAGTRAIGALGSLIGELPLPSLLGIRLADLEVGPAPGGGGYLLASGQLVTAE